MSAAIDETGEYSIATRFGGKQKIYHDKKWRRPASVSEMLHQIEATRLSNKWSWAELAENCRAVGLPVRAASEFSPADLREFTPEQLKRILDDFEKYRMILYEA